MLRKLQISIMYFFSGKMGKMHKNKKLFPALPKLRKRISKFECGTQLQRRTFVWMTHFNLAAQHRRNLGSFISPIHSAWDLWFLPQFISEPSTSPSFFPRSGHIWSCLVTNFKNEKKVMSFYTRVSEREKFYERVMLTFHDIFNVLQLCLLLQNCYNLTALLDTVWRTSSLHISFYWRVTRRTKIIISISE